MCSGGLIAGVIVTLATSWIARRQAPRKVDRWFPRLQPVSATASSHGTNDAQKCAGIIAAALVTGGVMSVYKVPYWVIICCALAVAGGTMAGGWRVVKTMGQQITKRPDGGAVGRNPAHFAGVDSDDSGRAVDGRDVSLRVPTLDAVR